METPQSPATSQSLHAQIHIAMRRAEAPAGGTGPEAAWMRRFEQVRLGGDALEMSELSLAAARRCLDDLDIEGCLSHLHRVDRLLAASLATPRMLGVLGDMAELTLHAASLARGLSDEEDPLRTRRLSELTRDRCYAVTARLDRVDDVGVRSAVLLRMASVLEAGGDLADAQVMRANARAVRE
jgi:hypothetical protein